MAISSRRSRARWGLADLFGRAAFLAGIACVVLASRSPWWIAGAVPLLALGVWLTIVEFRAQRNAVADEALEAAAEYDRTHPSESADGNGENRSG